MHLSFMQNFIDKIRKKIKNIHNFGENNIIKINPEFDVNLLSELTIYGNNNIIEINTKDHFYASIFIGTPDCNTNNCKIVIGEHSTANGVFIRLLDDNSICNIGSDVMFSNDISIFCSDTHSIYNKNKELINLGKFVEIGNHVWIGTGVKIGKNTKIPDNCIVGMGSIVTSVFDEQNCVIAGNPAKIVKRDVNWSRLRPNQYKV